MTETLKVWFDGFEVGTLAQSGNGVYFEYSPAFIASGHELSPLALPLGSGLKSRDVPATQRLHGLFEDSLPDAWGTRVMDDWFRRQGRNPAAVTPLQRLACIGDRGFGALTYSPAQMPDADAVNLSAYYQTATELETAQTSDLARLATVSISAGGAHPKIAVWLDEKNGQISAKPSEQTSAWLVKFTTGKTPDGIREHEMMKLAKLAGIEVPESRLLRTEHADGPSEHFAVRRFDRVGNRRIHYHSLAGVCQMLGADLDYQTFLRVTRKLTADHREVLKAYRRAVFNVLFANRDDHGKNHGFLYENRQWRLSPAFDLTSRTAAQLPERGMAILGERQNAGLKHLRELAQREGISRKDSEDLLAQVQEVNNSYSPTIPRSIES